MDYLEKILSAKKERLAAKKKLKSLANIKEDLKSVPRQPAPSQTAPRPGNFKNSISGGKSSLINIICELKAASPSAGIIRQDYNVKKLAGEMEATGMVRAISVLTEETYFRGDLFHLMAVRDSVSLPVIRKDFIIDEYQIYESVLYGADAVLLISEILPDSRLDDFVALCGESGIDCLVELHRKENLDRVLKSGAEIIGINNRNLSNFTVDINTTLELVPLIPADRIVVSESGIKTREDVGKLKSAGVGAILVGEMIMRAPDIKRALEELIT
ncbi:MAG: indole-3-glycerol phosphate synthase TrpC [Elusimicrobia bacterium]|nr:indole-3-glycerol phosphate synthase TrpC [Elusimicrobiota bacterium]